MNYQTGELSLLLLSLEELLQRAAKGEGMGPEGDASDERDEPDLPEIQSELGPYRLKRALGQGGQGVVYLAYQKSTKRKVAIKVLLQGPYASTSAKRRFEREIELVANLKHPNLISIFHS